MMTPSSLYLFKQRLKAGLLSVTDNPDEKAFIERHAFGGIHVIFGGDFYQLGDDLLKNLVIGRVVQCSHNMSCYCLYRCDQIKLPQRVSS